MGVTKKKAYLKPEMTKFEMKMEAPFMSASRPELEEGDIVEIDCFTISNNNFADGGDWNKIFKGEVGGTVTTTLKNLEQNAKILYERGFDSGNCVKLTKGDPRCAVVDGAISISVELISKDPCVN